MKYKKIELPYAYNALEPYIDEETVRTHYDKHHSTYESKFNDAIAGTAIEDKYECICSLMKDYNNIPEEYKGVVRTTGGGIINHNKYFKQFVIDRELTEEEKEDINKIIDTFGSIDEFRDKFISKGLSVFGSGWVWLIEKDNTLEITTTINQENPLMYGADRLIIGIDVWEHAYYLKYKQDRKSYLENVLKLTIIK